MIFGEESEARTQQGHSKEHNIHGGLKFLVSEKVTFCCP